MNEPLSNSNNRIAWLDGIKGFSCLFIFLHHFFLQYYPATYYGEAQPSLVNGFDTFLASSPLGVFINGNFFVHLFILISGYVITYQIIKMKPEKIGFFLFKRYLKLLFPLFIFSVFFLISRIPEFLNSESLIKSICSALVQIFNSLFFGILFRGDTYLGDHLWMMNCIFLGGIFVSIIASLRKINNERKIIKISSLFGFLCIFTSLFFLETNLRVIHFASIFFGCTLCLINQCYEIKLPKTVIFILLSIGIFLGGYPTGVIPTNIYKIILFRHIPSNYLWHCIAAVLIIFSISISRGLQQVFEKRCALYLAKISFWIFLLHPLIVKKSRVIFDNFQNIISNYHILVLMIFLVNLVLILSMSFFLTKFVSPIGNRLITCFIDSLLKKDNNV